MSTLETPNPETPVVPVGGVEAPPVEITLQQLVVQKRALIALGKDKLEELGNWLGKEFATLPRVRYGKTENFPQGMVRFDREGSPLAFVISYDFTEGSYLLCNEINGCPQLVETLEKADSPEELEKKKLSFLNKTAMFFV